MKLQDLILEMDNTNGFIKRIDGNQYVFDSEITGICRNYYEFIRACKREFVDHLAAINADVASVGNGNFVAFYPFDGGMTEFDFTIKTDRM